jgi:hypothetical protein
MSGAYGILPPGSVGFLGRGRFCGVFPGQRLPLLPLLALTSPISTAERCHVELVDVAPFSVLLLAGSATAVGDDVRSSALHRVGTRVGEYLLRCHAHEVDNGLVMVDNTAFSAPSR